MSQPQLPVESGQKQKADEWLGSGLLNKLKDVYQSFK